MATTTYANCKIAIVDNTAATAESISGAMTVAGTVVTITGFSAGSYTTASTGANLAGGGNINTGDYITLTYGAVNVGLLATHSYTVTLLYTPTGETALLSFLIFHIFFIDSASLGNECG